MALSARLHRQDYTTYVMLGDGEIQEGLVWEAAMAANHHELKNLIAIIDCNGVQINGWVNDIMTVEPLADKWRAFGWKVVEVNGHNMKDVLTDGFIAEHGRPNVMIIDPPRSGMHEDVVNVILNARPERIVYVSCNPATQARDLALMDSLYRVEEVQPVDMFPHTHHVENVVRMTRR